MMSLSRPDFHVTAMSHFSVLASHFIFFGEFSDFEGYASVSVFDLFKVCTLCPVQVIRLLEVCFVKEC